jgi:hypothetical protein
LKCIGRIAENVIDKEKITWIDTNPIHKFKYLDVMLYTDVPEDARNDVARKVADEILDKLREEQVAKVADEILDKLREEQVAAA